MERGKNFWLVGGVVGGLTFIALIFLAYLVYRLVESHQLMRFMTVDYELEHIDEKAAWVGTTLGGVVGLRVALTGSVLAFVGRCLPLSLFISSTTPTISSKGNSRNRRKIWRKSGSRINSLLCWIYTGELFRRWKWSRSG